MSPRAVGDRFAVLGGEQAREIVEFALDEFQEFEHHAGTALRIGGGPGGEGGLRIGDRLVDVGLVGHATLACTSPVLGLKTSPNRPDDPFTSLPPMK